MNTLTTLVEEMKGIRNRIDNEKLLYPHRREWERVFGEYTPGVTIGDIRDKHTAYSKKYYQRILNISDLMPRQSTKNAKKKSTEFKTILDRALKDAEKDIRLEHFTFGSQYNVRPTLWNRIRKHAYGYSTYLPILGATIPTLFPQVLQLLQEYSPDFRTWQAHLTAMVTSTTAFWVLVTMMKHLFEHRSFALKIESMKRWQIELNDLELERNSFTNNPRISKMTVRALDTRIAGLKNKLKKTADALFRAAYRQGREDVINLKPNNKYMSKPNTRKNNRPSSRATT